MTPHPNRPQTFTHNQTHIQIFKGHMVLQGNLNYNQKQNTVTVRAYNTGVVNTAVAAVAWQH